MDSQYLMKIWKLLKNTIFGDSKISGSKYTYEDVESILFYLFLPHKRKMKYLTSVKRDTIQAPLLARNRKIKYRAHVKQNTAKS